MTQEIKEVAVLPKTVKVSPATHEQLRVLAFKKNIKIKALIDLLLKEHASK